MAGTRFAGIWCRLRSARVSVEAPLAVLAVTAFCVVAAAVTHAAAPPSRCKPQSSTEVAALGVAITFAPLAFMRRPCDAVGSLPGLVIVKRCAALTVVTGCVVSANTLAMNHVTGLLLAGLVAPGRHTVISVSVAKAAAFHNEIVDCVIVCWELSSIGMFGLAGTRLSLQQTHSQVGDHELILSSRTVRIHRVPGRQGSIDHLSSGAGESCRILGGACGSTPLHRRAVCHSKVLLAVPGEIPEGPPCAPVVLGALQLHGGGAGGAEDQDQVGEEELRLQVQLERLLARTPRGLPPGVGVAEGGVAHGGGRVRLAGDGGAAPAALRGGAGLPAAGGRALFVEAVRLRGVEAAHRPGAEHSALGQVAHAGVAGSA